MLREGFFLCNDVYYDLHEIDIQGFYRFDIVTHGASFNVDFANVLYSQLQRKQSYSFGDASIYEKFLDIKQRALSLKLVTKQDRKWENGVFVCEAHSASKNNDTTVDSILHNNILISQKITAENCTIYMYEADRDYSIKLEPINFSEYTQTSLSKDTVMTDQPDQPFHSVETLRRRYPLDHIYDNDFVVADSVIVANARLTEWKNKLTDYKGFDTETTGLDVNICGSDKMVGIILGESETKSTYFPFRHKSIDNLSMDFLRVLMDAVMSESHRLVAHNKKFDRMVMLKEGYDLRIKWCTYQISMILDPQMGKDHPHDLKTLIYLLTGKTYAELDKIFLSTRDIDFSVLPKELVHLYACSDGSSVISLILDQMKRLPKYQMRLVKLECSLADLKADMEYYGIRVDVKKFEEQYRNVLFIRDTLLKMFQVLTKEDGNVNSSNVLQNLLYNKMKCDILLRTATGLPSCSTKTIDKLASKKTPNVRKEMEDIKDMNGDVVIKGSDLSESKYPALLLLSKYKEYNKLVTAFFARFERTMKTGRIFFWINQNGAASGRQSSPMHQLPKIMKTMILADSDDKDFWGPDYAQVELRMIAYLSGEKDLIKLCADPVNDIHRVIYSLISGKEMWEVTGEMRSSGKRRNFGVVYMIKAFGLAQQIFGPGPTKEQVQFCQEQLDEFYRRFKRIKRFIQKNGEFVQKHGYMETKWLHRRRMFDDIFDPDLEPRRRSSILRMGNNMPVQGTAADYLKQAEVYMYEYIRKKGWNEISPDGFPIVRIMLSIHDEIILSSHHAIPYEEILKMIATCMEIPVEGAPPFFAEPVKMKNWGDHDSEQFKVTVPLRDKLIADYDRTGVSVMNRDTYEAVVTQYESSVIHEYMTNLVAEYGTDYNIVSNQVRHPTLTHKLLGLYENRISFKLEHVERIKLATKYYIEEVLPNEGCVADVSMLLTTTLEDRENDSDIQDSLSVSYGELTDLVTCDKDGNVVYEENDQEDLSDTWYDDSEDYEEVLADAKNPVMYVFELADSIVFDTAECSKHTINEVLQYITANKADDGFFRTFVMFNDKLIDTKMRVEAINMEEANQLIINKIEAERTVTI